MEDLLEVYCGEYDDQNPLICMDEASKQLVAEVRSPIPLQPGEPKKYDAQYERNGVSSIFMCCEPLTGKCFVNVSETRTAVDWAHQIKELAEVRYPNAEHITLVMANLNLHTGASLYKAFEPAEARRIVEKLDIHYTPKHGSWLNMAEINLSVLSHQCLDRRISAREILTHEIQAWEARHNASPAPVKWRFTTEAARVKLKRLYPSI